MSELYLFASGLIAGLTIGAWGAWQMWLGKERPIVKANFLIDPATLHQINAQMTLAWLDSQGLTWTAKGAVFNYKAKKE